MYTFHRRDGLAGPILRQAVPYAAVVVRLEVLVITIVIIVILVMVIIVIVIIVIITINKKQS